LESKILIADSSLARTTAENERQKILDAIASPGVLRIA
jgi:hypothetical protein